MIFLNHISIQARAHKIALIFALFIIIVSAAPHILGVYSASPFHGAPLLIQSDEDVYLSRIRAIYEGDLLVHSPVFLEYKDSPIAVFPIGEYLYLVPAIFGIPFLLSVIIIKIILPSILFLAVYFFMFSFLSGDETDGPPLSSRLTAIAAALLVVFGYDLTILGHLLSIINNPSQLVNFSVWGRLVNPITGGIFLFCFLQILWRVFKTGGNRFMVIVGGATLALMSGYIFSFGISCGILFILAALSVFLRKLRSFYSYIVIGILGVTPFFAQLFITFWHSSENISLGKNGLLTTNTPLVNTFVLAVAVFLLFTTAFLKYKEKFLQDRTYFCWAIVIGTFFAYNQQVFTGKTVWPAHFVQYSIPLSFIVAIACFHRLFSGRSPSVYRLIMYGLSAVAIVLGILSVSALQKQSGQYNNLNRSMAAFNWLNKNAPTPCVVLSSELVENLSFKIPAYTKCKSYYSPYVFFGVPEERIVHNYFSLLRLRGISPDDISLYLVAHSSEARASFFRDWKDLFRDMQYPWLASIGDRTEIDRWYQDLSVKLTSQYKIFFQTDFYSQLKKYRLDYVVWDSKLYSSWYLDALSFMKEVYTSEGIHIYEVR